MQIGEFKDWNIKNINNEKISSKNVKCQEKPPNPRGGNFKKMCNHILSIKPLDGCRINWFYYMSSNENPVSRCVRKGK